MPQALLMQQPLQVLPLKHGSLKYFPETPRETLEDLWLLIAATGLVGVFQVFRRPPMETLFKDCYFVSGSGIGRGIAK